MELGTEKKQQVLDIMGEPEEIDYATYDSGSRELWYYDSRWFLGTPLRCDFDPATQEVVRIYCGARSEKLGRRPTAVTDRKDRTLDGISAFPRC